MAPLANRIRGLDALRFVLATVVVLGHFQPVAIDPAWPSLVRVLVRNLWQGPAAVIAFFVVSGLCIHYPNRHGSSIRLLPFYLRREVRILVPVVVAIYAFRLLGKPIEDLQESTLWSLLCEEIYYLIYPLLLIAFRKIGLRKLIGVSYVVAYAIVILVPNPRGFYIDYGWRLTWLLGLPCWLLGCELAEQIDDRANPAKATSVTTIWVLRFAVFATAVAHGITHFHPPLHLQIFRANWTLDVLALLYFAWIRAEIFYYGTRPAPRFERLGAGSYSLYLTHVPSAALWERLGGGETGPFLISFIFGCAYVFYKLVEKPSHSLARSVARRALGAREAGPALPARGTGAESITDRR